MADLYRARLALNAEREKLRLHLCSQYPGGPDGYKLVAPRCVRVRGLQRRQEASRRSRNNNTPNTEHLELLRGQLRHMRRVAIDLKEQVDRVIHSSASSEQNAVTAETSGPHIVPLIGALKDRMKVMPMFIFNAS